MVEAKIAFPGAEGPQNPSEKFVIPMAKDPVRAAAMAAGKAALEATLQAAAQLPRPLVTLDEASGTLRINTGFSVRADRHSRLIAYIWHKPSGRLSFGITNLKPEADAEAKLLHVKRSAAPAAMSQTAAIPRPRAARAASGSR